VRDSAKPDTWMPLVIGDYLKDTTRLNTEQHGAYLLLIMSYWVNGPPADDDDELAAVTGLDLKTWRRHRDKLAKFFRIEGGVWRHKRVEEELERWSAKKEKYVARAAAGGRAKAAKSSASSTPQALLGECAEPCLQAAPQPASTEVEANKEASTLSGRQDADERADGSPSPVAWAGPESVWAAFAEALGEPWCERFLRPCRWQDVPDRALIPPHPTIGAKMLKDCRPLLAKLGLQLLEKAA
jgi:uncharacterized protein YdaU (DUF1376 family)